VLFFRSDGVSFLLPSIPLSSPVGRVRAPIRSFPSTSTSSATNPRAARGAGHARRYGDFECPYCGRAEPSCGAADRLRPRRAYFWRPLRSRLAPNAAQLAPCGRGSGGGRNRFWEYHDRCSPPDALAARRPFLLYARELDLDTDSSGVTLERRWARRRWPRTWRRRPERRHRDSTFFVNGRRTTAPTHRPLTAAVRAAGARASIWPLAATACEIRSGRTGSDHAAFQACLLARQCPDGAGGPRDLGGLSLGTPSR